MDTIELSDLRRYLAALVGALPEHAPVVLPREWVQELLGRVDADPKVPFWTSAAELGPMIGPKPLWLVRHAAELPFARRLPGSRRILFDVQGARRWMYTRPQP